MSKNWINGLGNHESHSQTHSVKKDYDHISDKDIFCDALNCNSEAVEKIQLSAGIYGTLLFNVCKNCIGIFKREGGDTNDSYWRIA